MALPDTQPLHGGAPLARAHRGPGLGSAALRLLNRYSFGFALLLSIALLIANLVEESGSFSVTNQLADLAPLALAGMASTPSIISGGGGFDLTVSPVMILTGGLFAGWLHSAAL